MMPAIRWFAIAVLGLWAVGAAAESSDLASRYDEIRERLQRSAFERPLYVHSDNDGDRLSAEVFSLVEHPFAALSETLATPAKWCEFIPLNLNIKACTYRDRPQPTRLTLYIGHKEYEPPESAHAMDYEYHVVARERDYLRVELAAEQGPWGTKDYRIDVEAIPVAEGTLVHIRTGYRTSWASRLAASAYLATVGRDKIGFTVVEDEGPNGGPRFIQGVQGIIERNAMRYYLTLEAFMLTRHLPANERFEARIAKWHELTGRYAKQLRELERDQYLQAKRRERKNRLQLQAELTGQREAVAQN